MFIEDLYKCFLKDYQNFDSFIEFDLSYSHQEDFDGLILQNYY